MNAIYETTVEVTGGRTGHGRLTDGLLNLDLALPRQLGGDARAPTRSNWNRRERAEAIAETSTVD